MFFSNEFNRDANNVIDSPPSDADSKPSDGPKEEGFLKSAWHKLMKNTKCSETEKPGEQNNKESTENEKPGEQNKNESAETKKDEEQKKS